MSLLNQVTTIVVLILCVHIASCLTVQSLIQKRSAVMKTSSSYHKDKHAEKPMEFESLLTEITNNKSNQNSNTRRKKYAITSKEIKSTSAPEMEKKEAENNQEYTQDLINLLKTPVNNTSIGLGDRSTGAGYACNAAIQSACG